MAARNQRKVQAQWAARRWNSTNAPGTAVVLELENGTRWPCSTRGIAFVSQSHACVLLDGAPIDSAPIEALTVESTQGTRAAVVTPQGEAGCIRSELSFDAVSRQVREFFGAGTLACAVSP